MICLHCTQLDMKANPTMAREGFGTCKHELAPNRYVSLIHERECATFIAAAANVINTREAWNEKRSS